MRGAGLLERPTGEEELDALRVERVKVAPRLAGQQHARSPHGLERGRHGACIRDAAVRPAEEKSRLDRHAPPHVLSSPWSGSLPRLTSALRGLSRRGSIALVHADREQRGSRSHGSRSGQAGGVQGFP